MDKKKISARFPEDLLEEIDTVAKLEYKDRTALMKEALKEYIDRGLEEGRLKEEATRRYLRGDLTYHQLEKLLGVEDAQAIKASRQLLEEGERLAKKLA